MWKKLLKAALLVVALIVVGFGFLIYKDNERKKSVSEQVIKFAESYLEGKRTYWFEMSNMLNGQFDPVILVFGYWDNREPCEFMREYAQKASPNRSFRCREVR